MVELTRLGVPAPADFPDEPAVRDPVVHATSLSSRVFRVFVRQMPAIYFLR
jgi:hypothetical protein